MKYRINKLSDCLASDSIRLEKELVKLLQKEWPDTPLDTGLDEDNLYCVYVALSGSGELIGGAIVHSHDFLFPPKWLFISFLIVSKSHREKGIGTAILNECKKEVSEMESFELALYAERLNKKNRKYYEKNGFVCKWEEPNIYPDGGYACVYIWEP